MTIGSLGSIVFSVSSSRTETINSFKQSKSSSFAEHSLHCGDKKLEYTGRNSGKVTFGIILAEKLGVNVEEEISKINSAVQSGEIMRLIIGKTDYGKYVIADFSASRKNADRTGNTTLAEVSLSLTEYK